MTRRDVIQKAIEKQITWAQAAAIGMLVHQDASTHTWIEWLPMADLVVTLDDADGRILHAMFVPQEGTMSSLQSIGFVLRRWGRFCEFYTDRGGHKPFLTSSGSCGTTRLYRGRGSTSRSVSEILTTSGSLRLRPLRTRTPS